jgi:hypothetical protein
MSVEQNEDVLLEVDIRGQTLQVTPAVLEELRNFIGVEGEQIANHMSQLVNSTGRDIMNQTCENLCGAPLRRENSATVSCEVLGKSLAAKCLDILENAVPKWIEDAERTLAELIGGAVRNPQEQEKFRQELSAFAFVLFCFQIFNLTDADECIPIFMAFDDEIARGLCVEFVEFADRRAETYSKCLRENWGSDNLGFAVTTCFNQFCLGAENLGDEPLIVDDLFASHARGMAALAALKTVFGVGHAILFPQPRLAILLREISERCAALDGHAIAANGVKCWVDQWCVQRALPEAASLCVQHGHPEAAERLCGFQFRLSKLWRSSRPNDIVALTHNIGELGELAHSLLQSIDGDQERRV